MKLSWFICAVLLLPGISSAQLAENPRLQSLPIGAAIPGIQQVFLSVKGGKTSLEHIKTDKGLLVMFSCNTCPYVIRSQKRTTDIIRLSRQKGIGMVIVNSNEAQRSGEDSYEAMVNYARAQGYQVPYILDEHSALANEFGSTRTPEVFLFDGAGKLVYKGAMEDNPSEPAQSKSLFLEQAIRHMLAGEPIDPAETRSIGCSIKRLL